MSDISKTSEDKKMLQGESCDSLQYTLNNILNRLAKLEGA